MTGQTSIDQKKFHHILTRNISLPLALGTLSGILFLGLTMFLISTLNWVEHTQKVMSNGNEVGRLSSEMEASMRGFLISGDESFLQPYNVARARSSSQILELTELVNDNPAQLEHIRHVAALQLQWNEYAQDIIAKRRQNLPYLELVASKTGKILSDEIRNELSLFDDAEERLLIARNQSAKSTSLWIVLGYLVFSLGISALLALMGRRELVKLSVAYGTALDQQDKDARVLEQLAWLRDGQSHLAEQMIGQKTLMLLGETVLDFSAQYLGIAVAALYVRHENGDLRRVASYGFSLNEKNSAQSFYTNDGLVGQAGRSCNVLQLDDLPENYLRVGSGLGYGALRHVLLIPLVHEGEVKGVAELGFLRPLVARDLEFVKLIAGNVGTAIHGAQYRDQRQALLAQAQQLNEELQVQQEELRTANEELEEQSRTLRESQINLEKQKNELENTNHQLAHQTMALDQRNSDLTEVQTALEQRAIELISASRYKSEFLANMSHELRTPLNSSLILAKLLADNSKGNLDAEQIKFAQSIYSAGNDLLNLINDILDISKVEAGKLELTPENIRISKLLDSLKDTFEPLAGQKQLKFVLNSHVDAPSVLVSDRQRVEQILKNLLSNAIKFTESGEISLTVSALDDGQIAFAVCDSGIGIPAHQQQIIFEAFQQADGTTSRRYGGTGLGLSISRDLAALLGGKISVQSSQGQGSVFTLQLPAKWHEPDQDKPDSSAPDTPVVHAAPAVKATNLASPKVLPDLLPGVIDDRQQPLGSRVVLIIEDDKAFAQILFDLAHELNYSCLVSHSAEDGYKLASQFVPQAILLDMGLPDDSGLSVLQRLKNNPSLRHIPVHVVSAQDQSAAALQMGAIGYAVKPASREQLKQVFKKLEDKLTQKVKHVLLVEDDERQRDSVMHLIGDGDVQITAVETGEEALSLLKGIVFDCMIIDLKLPDIQGSELLRRMSSEDILSFPPVIVYTGRNLSRAEEAELLKYSRSIIIKGARSPERLLDEVTLFLHTVESDLSYEHQSMLKTARSRDRVFDGRKVLLVDDDMRNIFALTSALEQKGIAVEIGRNGFEAISKLDEVSDIDLVLMDIMMPGIDGLETTRRIRQNPRFKKLPIIAVTAKAMKDDQQQCLKAGANDYLAKPIDLDRLFSLLRVWMPHVERI
ncbi:Sensory/regulatory protein RpfC [Polaromonas vacuolata]|uniref:Virulence sensor protein BvgS n=1 Tax=Polaromonas vacuolata TaxID=37448 RepID=A0A6H2HBT8_9BURK|nr:response regulator [Polaromonas vacuolata]QJC57339.1 Sensory/regulatory protein RpfC [Polaromonas vacuolata]